MEVVGGGGVEPDDGGGVVLRRGRISRSGVAVLSVKAQERLLSGSCFPSSAR